MKIRIAMIAVLGVAMISTWFVYSKITQNRRDDAYRSAIAPYQQYLHAGMSRDDVDKFLDARQVPHYPERWGSDGVVYEIKIGEDPSTLICEWNVYIAFEFDRADKLTDIRIKKEGTCI